jgi:hypothetical protein
MTLRQWVRILMLKPLKAKVLLFVWNVRNETRRTQYYLRMWYNMAVVVSILCCLWRWWRSSLFEGASCRVQYLCGLGFVLCKVLIRRVVAVIHGCMCVCARGNGSVV